MAFVNRKRTSSAEDRAKRIYVAGPMTGYAEHNRPAFNAAAEMLRAEGWDVENPADHPFGTIPWGDCLRYDLIAVVGCEALFLLPGWSASKGATLEVSVAIQLGMKLLYSPKAETFDDVAKAQGRLAKALVYSLECFRTMSSADGSGHADLAKGVLRLAGLTEEQLLKLIEDK